MKNDPLGVKSDPLGFWNGKMLPANVAQRYMKKWRAPDALVFPMLLEHGGWTAENNIAELDTDRLFKRFILAERCGLSVEIDKATGCAKSAQWLLTTGEELFGEFPLKSVPFEDVDIKRLKHSTDLNLSSTKRVAVAASGAAAAWYSAAEHLPAIGEIALVLGVSGAVLAENRVRVGLKWGGEGENNYAVGSMIAHAMSVVDAIRNQAPIYPPEGA